MQAFARILRSRISLSAFLADTRALAATEFAVIVPLMLVMFFGTVEFSSAVAIDRKVTLIARTLSDLTSQSPGTLTDANLQNTFTASISIMTPYDATLVKGTISQIYIDANKIATVQWSKAATIASGATQATLATSTRSAGDKVTSIIPAGLLNASSYLIFSEVDYTYTPTVGYVLKSSLPLHDISYTRPRQVSCIMYGGAPASC
jgi:Flp pilus assembly protein TadG